MVCPPSPPRKPRCLGSTPGSEPSFQAASIPDPFPPTTDPTPRLLSLPLGLSLFLVFPCHETSTTRPPCPPAPNAFFLCASLRALACQGSSRRGLPDMARSCVGPTIPLGNLLLSHSPQAQRGLQKPRPGQGAGASLTPGNLHCCYPESGAPLCIPRAHSTSPLGSHHTTRGAEHLLRGCHCSQSFA